MSEVYRRGAVTKRTVVVRAAALCMTEGCDFEMFTANAPGNGARHAQKYGHHVEVERTTRTSWNDPEDIEYMERVSK